MHFSFNAPAVVRATSAGAFLFFAAMFALPSGYSYGGGLLLLTSLWMLAARPSYHLERDDRVLMWTFLAYFAATAIMVLWLGNKTNDIDQSLRALLAIPVLLLLLHVRVRLSVLWAGVIIGIVLSAGVAWWQVAVLHRERAEGFLNIIHFSNIALVFTTFCMAGLVWASTQGRHAVAWRIAFVLGIACGLYSVIQGGSRGSWVAAPVAVAVFTVALLSRRNLVYCLSILAAAAVTIVFLFSIPDGMLRQRYDAAVHDVTQYRSNNADTSIGARFEMWRGAAANLARQPILGWNQQDYDQALQAMVDKGELSGVALQFNDNLHNNYLQAWVFTGLPGLLALLALYSVPLWHFGRRLRDADLAVRAIAICGMTLTASYWCFSLTQVILRRNNGIMFFVLALVILWGALRQARQHASSPSTVARQP